MAGGGERRAEAPQERLDHLDHADHLDALPRTLPPGQRLSPSLKVKHYGRVPTVRPDRWRLTVSGATRDGAQLSLTLPEVQAMETVRVVADHHCASGWSTVDQEWTGVPVRSLLALAPPADHVTHVVAWAEYGYSATVRLEDLASPRALLATGLGGEPLTPEHGWPLRLVVPHLYGYKGPKWLRGLEYVSVLQRGFWEQRGYHVTGDAWRQERYSYQE